MAAECVISLTEAPRSGPSRGGRHVEFGASLALGKRLIVAGHRENVFHCLPQVEFHASWPEALDALAAESRASADRAATDGASVDATFDRVTMTVAGDADGEREAAR